MNLSTPESPKPREGLVVLLVGPPGQGKSTLLFQFPDLGVFDIDRNTDGAIAFIERARKQKLTYAYEQVWMKEGKPIEIHECFENLIVQMTSCRDHIKAGKLKLQFVGVDGLTILGEMIKQKIYKDQRRDAMEARDWDVYKSSLAKALIVRAREIAQLGVHFIITCHEYPVTKKDPKDIMKEDVVGYVPAVQGGIAHTFNGLFTDVWRCSCVPAPAGRIDYRLHVVRDGMSDLKNTLNIPPAGLTWSHGELGYEKLAPYLKGIV